MSFGLVDGTYVAETAGATLGGLVAIAAWWRSHQQTLKERQHLAVERQRFEDRLFGVPADPDHGTPAEPGIFDKMDALTSEMQIVKTNVATVQRTAATTQATVNVIEGDLANVKEVTQQLKKNGGHSLADKISRMDATLVENVAALKKVQDDLHARPVVLENRPPQLPNTDRPRPRAL